MSNLKFPGVEPIGKVVRLVGPVLNVSGVNAAVGNYLQFFSPSAKARFGEVIGLERNSKGDALLSVMPLGESEGFEHGTYVALVDPKNAQATVIEPGCVVDGLGYSLDPQNGLQRYAQDSIPPIMGVSHSKSVYNPRTVEAFSLPTGIRALDICIPLVSGQRVALLAPAGVGKSTLLSMILNGTHADKVVLCLVGERGREATELVQQITSAGQLDRCVIVVATSDRPAAERAKAPVLAMQVAEQLCAAGEHVLVLIDSLTRYCRALREIGLAAGEAPTRRGYPASVFAALPKILERAGNFQVGSISMVASVLVEDELMPDPIAEEVQSLSDGHIWLSRTLAAQGRFPAIDILKSVSRMANMVQDLAMSDIANKVRRCLTSLDQNDTLIRMGEYRWGQNQQMDQEIQSAKKLAVVLSQSRDEFISIEDAVEQFETALT